MIFWNLQIKQKIPEAKASGNLLEVTTRFELVDEGFADHFKFYINNVKTILL